MKRPPLGGKFATLLTATGIGNLADGLLLTGAPLLAASLTRSPLLVSLVTAMTSLPWLIFALHAGALADRRDRKKIIVALAWTRAALLLSAAVAAVAGVAPLPLLYVVVFLAGISEVFSDVSSQSLIPLVVTRAQLTSANSRLTAVQNAANSFLAAPLAGVLIGFGAFCVFGIAGFLFTLSALVLIRLRGSFRANRPEKTTVRADIAQGLSFLVHHRLLRSVAVLSGTLNLAFTAYFSVFVLWASGPGSEIGLTPPEYGVLLVTLAMGSVMGAFLAEFLVLRLGETVLILGGPSAISLLLLVPWIVPYVQAVAPTFVLLAICLGATNVTLVSMRQRLIPPELLGRVNSSYRLIGMGTVPLGALVGGAIGSATNLETVFVSAVVIALSGVLAAAASVSARKILAAEIP